MKLNFLLPLFISAEERPILGAYTLMTCPVLPKLLENAEGAAAHQSTFLHLPWWVQQTDKSKKHNKISSNPVQKSYSFKKNTKHKKN